MWRIAIIALVACSDPPKQAFVVDGYVNVVTDPHASVIGLWQIPGSPAKYYKLGDGVRLSGRFTLGFDTDPPPEALGPDGIGVAYVAMLPELTTVPDGFVNMAAIGIIGISGETAIIYKQATATGPAWSTELIARFSCAQCVRNQGTKKDEFTLVPCAYVVVEGPASPTCAWF
jgi:hypothetical protein